MQKNVKFWLAMIFKGAAKFLCDSTLLIFDHRFILKLMTVQFNSTILKFVMSSVKNISLFKDFSLFTKLCFCYGRLSRQKDGTVERFCKSIWRRQKMWIVDGAEELDTITVLLS